MISLLEFFLPFCHPVCTWAAFPKAEDGIKQKEILYTEASYRIKDLPETSYYYARSEHPVHKAQHFGPVSTCPL
jgi:hypothetical protein